MNVDTEHDRILDDLPILLGGAPADERPAELRAHLGACPECAGRYWDLIDARDALLRASPEDTSPPDGARILEERMGLLPEDGARAPRRWWGLTAAAAMLLAFVAGWNIGPGAPVPPESVPAVETAVATSPPAWGSDAPVEVEQAYGQALEDSDQFSRALSFLSTMERDSR